MKTVWLPGFLLIIVAILLQSATNPRSSVKSNMNQAQLVELGRAVYQSQCSFCHQPKALNSFADMKSWTTLVYTSGCPQVTVRLTDLQRKQLLVWIASEFKNLLNTHSQ